MIPTDPSKKPRGLAAVSPEKRKEIARAGGRAAAQSGKAHRFTSEEAKAAGKRGGSTPKLRRRYRNLLDEALQ